MSGPDSIDPEDYLTPTEELMSSGEIFMCQLHWILSRDEDDRWEQIAALADRFFENRATERDEALMNEIAGSIWKKYDSVLMFDRLEFVPADNAAVAELVQRMEFLAIINHIEERETVSFAEDRQDGLETYLKFARDFLETAKSDFHRAIESLEYSVGELEEIFLQRYYFDAENSEA